MLNKKRLRKFSAILIGAILGWYAAEATAAGDGHAYNGPDMKLHVPQDDEAASWYPAVLAAAGSLFGLAIVVGVWASKNNIKEPGQKASEHDAAHAHH